MKEFKVCIKTIENAKSFVSLASKQDFNIDIANGRYIVDAKSIMGILSLDLSMETKVTCYCDDDRKVESFKNLIYDMLIG